MAHFYFENVPHGKRRDGTKVNTKSHYDYIKREGKYAHCNGREEDLVYAADGNIPIWAMDAGTFWQEAERNRRLNGRAYREFRFALQEEFTLQENIALVERLIEETGIKKHHAYSFAIHDKKATFAPEHRNIHCHLMFSEKIIEHDRPLLSEQYFKQYAENAQGQAVSGYRTSRQFISKETNAALRKRWAELCNEQFAAKGLDCRITEKSLATQREELLSQGKIEEAHLLDRQPAPHLGQSYRNERTMERIYEEIEQVSAASSSDDEEDDDDAAEKTKEEAKRQQEQSIHEMKILLFANDLVLRRLAREIQLERERLAKEQELRDAEIPVAVTVQDIREYLQAKQQPYRQIIAEKTAQCEAERKHVVHANFIRAHAIDRVLEGAYFATIRTSKNCSKELAAVQEKMDGLYGEHYNDYQTPRERIHELAVCMRKERELKQQIQEAKEKMIAFKKLIDGELASKIPPAEKAIKQENRVHEAVIEKLYGEIAPERRKVKFYEGILQSLADKKSTEALFTEKIPHMLDRYSKINGTIPVRKLQTISYQMESFALLSTLSKDCRTAKVYAVRLGDDVTRGTVPKYLIWISKDPYNRWKIDFVQPALDDKKQPMNVYLYPPHAPKEHINTSTISTIRQEALCVYKVKHQFRLIQIADALIEKEQSLHPLVQTNEKMEEQDKAIKAEEKLYKGRSR